MKLILASGSPRRAEILRHAGIAFEVFPGNVDESRLPRESAPHYVRRVALAKARRAAEHAARKGHPAIVIGADTVVVVGGKILGKPQDLASARRMLLLLSGRTHTVLTGLALVQIPGGVEKIHMEKTRVRFAKMSAKEIDGYLLTGEPYHKAGAYAIQGIGGRYVTRVEGCYFNVVGLPLARLCAMLRDFGWRAPASQIPRS
ncbi:MAG TPA: Maf family protein [Candidatus Limnocylindrales bacterium]|nr:Maf family protein [Candidatus Limnocylindrales bacterium]